MNLPRFSVRNPVPVNLLMIVVIFGGLVAGSAIIREFFPNIEPELVTITVPYPGATPEEIERSVTRLVEREIEDVDGVKEIRSSVFEGLTVIAIELDDGVDRNRVVNDLRGEVDKVIPDLPDDAEEPEISEARPFIPVIAVVVSGDVTEDKLHTVVEQVQDELLDLEEVTESLVTGFRKREFLVEIQPDRLEEYGITFEQVGRAVGALNVDVPGGQLKGDRTNIRVRTVGEERVTHELENRVVLASPDGTAVRLGDVARVMPGFEDKTERGSFLRIRETDSTTATRKDERAPTTGQSAASITVFKTPEQDAIKIAERVRAFVADAPTRMGGAVKLETTTDLSRLIQQRIDLMTRNAIAGLILVLICLAVFLELRIAIWVALGLGFAFMGTFIVMYFTGQTINLISLFGLIVVLGLIVDDAIVIAENIFRRRREGMPPLEAAEKGTNEVAVPVITAVLTTCAAFGPLAFIEGRMGDFLGVLPGVVICALGVSLIEAFLILPRHLAHGRHGPPSDNAFSRFFAKWRTVRHRFFEETLPGILGRSLRFLIRWRYVSVATMFVTVILMAGLVVGGIVPFVLLQDTDAETITSKLEMAAGTPEARTIETLSRIEQIVAAQPEVGTVFTVVGTSFGDRGRQVASDPAVVGQITIELLSAESRELDGLRTSTDLLTALRRETAQLPGVRRISFTSQGGGPQGADLEVRVRSTNLEDLRKGVAYVRDKMAAFSGVSEIYDDLELGKLEARLRLRPEARLMGLSTVDVAVQVRHALFGFEAQDLQIGNEEVTVRVMLPEQRRRNLEDLGTLRIALPNGRRVPIEELVTFTTDRGYASLSRVDGKRAATIKAEVDQRTANTAQITAELQRDIADIGERFPGVSVTFEGARKETRESVGSLFYLFPAALLFIFAIIAVLFRSYLQPIVVMAAIPFAMVGAIVGHFLMGYPFTILSMIGLVALAGIVVNDGLILVDFINRRRRKGQQLEAAVVDAAKGRMRPILLTSITTCAGLAPLMLETSFQAQFLIPMAVSIVFGLAFATGIILVLIPLLVIILEDVRACLRWLFGGPWSRQLGYDPAAGVGASSSELSDG